MQKLVAKLVGEEDGAEGAAVFEVGRGFEVEFVEILGVRRGGRGAGVDVLGWNGRGGRGWFHVFPGDWRWSGVFEERCRCRGFWG